MSELLSVDQPYQSKAMTSGSTGDACPFNKAKGRFYQIATLVGPLIVSELNNIPTEMPDTNCEDPSERVERALKSDIREAMGGDVIPEGVTAQEVEDLSLYFPGLRLGRESRIGSQRLVEYVLPGAQEAPVAIMSLLSRMKDFIRIFGLDISPDRLARSSHGLLDTLMDDDAQRAKAVMFSLVSSGKVITSGGDDDTAITFERRDFMPDELIKEYMEVKHNKNGIPYVSFRKSIDDFSVDENVAILDRVENPLSPSLYIHGKNGKLSGIPVNEQRFGCPMKKVAKNLWGRGIRLAVQEGLWDDAS